MNKYFLNLLRFLTRGECPDWILRKSFNHKFENGKFKFNFKANIDTKGWKRISGKIVK